MHRDEVFGPGEIKMFYPGHLHVIAGLVGAGKTQTALKSTLPMLTEHEGWSIDFIDRQSHCEYVLGLARSVIGSGPIRSNGGFKFCGPHFVSDGLEWFANGRSNAELRKTIIIVDELGDLAFELSDGNDLGYGYNQASHLLKEVALLGPTVIATVQQRPGDNYGPVCESANVIYGIHKEAEPSDHRLLEVRKNRFGPKAWNKKDTKVCLVGPKTLGLYSRASNGE